MYTRNEAIIFSAKAFTMGLLLASSSAFAQEVAPTATVAPVTLPPVQATVQPVTPPPVVRTLPNENDSVAPQAAAAVEAKRAERAPARSEAVPARRNTVVRAPVIAPEPPASTNAAAPEAPVPANTAAIDAASVAPAEEPVTEVAQTDIAPVNDAATDNDWLLGAGIVGALGLAGIALLTSRRRRRRSGDVVSEKASAVPATYAEPPRDIPRPIEQPIARPAAAPVFATTAADPLFSRPRHDVPVAAPAIRDASNLPGVTDPLFSHRPEQIPVIDPMFARKVEVPAITDPMFAEHPKFEGAGGDRAQRFGDNRIAYDRTRELEPAE